MKKIYDKYHIQSAISSISPFKRIFAYHETNSQSLIQERSTICVQIDQTWMIRKRRLKLGKWT